MEDASKTGESKYRLRISPVVFPLPQKSITPTTHVYSGTQITADKEKNTKIPASTERGAVSLKSSLPYENATEINRKIYGSSNER